jgi:SAM-dependent methyltransferase
MHALLKKIHRRLPKPPSSNFLYREIKPSPYDFLPSNPVIFDIGSKDARASYAFGDPPPGARVVCVDLFPGKGVDLVADAHDMHMVPDNSVDFVTSISVLEHVRDPQRVVREIYRILKPGGVIYVSVPFVYNFHGDPDDFYRFSFRGVAILCEAFERLDNGFNRGPASAMQQLLPRFLAILFSFNSDTLYSVNLYVFRWGLAWMKYLDRFIGNYKMAYLIHGSSYFIGRKPIADTRTDLSSRPSAAQVAS